jgi:O-antigen/teichoic acid export membrane protein
MSARSLALNAFWSLLCHLASRGALMVAAVLVARTLDTPSFAAFSYFQLTVSMLAAYSAMGLGVAASRYCAAADADEGRSATPVGTLWLLSVGLALAAFAVVMMVPGDFLSGGLGVPRWLLAAGVTVLVLQVVPDGAILGLERYRTAAAIVGTAGVLTLCGTALAVHLGDVRVAMVAVIVASLIQSVGESVIVVRALGWQRFADGLRPRMSNVKRVLNFSGPMFLVSVMSASGGWLVGRIILDGPGGTSEFALFTIGLQWFALAMFIPGVLSRVLLPRLVRSAGGDSGAGSRQLVRVALVMTTISAAFVGVAGWVGGPWIMRLYGDRYRAGTLIIGAFLTAAVVSAPANSLGNALLARERQWQWLGLTAVWSVVLMSSAIVFRSHGAWGGGLTYTAAYASLTAGALLLARRESLV